LPPLAAFLSRQKATAKGFKPPGSNGQRPARAIRQSAGIVDRHIDEGGRAVTRGKSLQSRGRNLHRECGPEGGLEKEGRMPTKILP
jgi:hypothetical protein